MSCTLEDQLKEVQRELAIRRSFYAKQVARGLMPHELADRRIELMEAVQKSVQMLIAPVPELAGTHQVVLYFPTAADLDGFISCVQEALPNLVSKKI